MNGRARCERCGRSIGEDSWYMIACVRNGGMPERVCERCMDYLKRPARDDRSNWR